MYKDKSSASILSKESKVNEVTPAKITVLFAPCMLLIFILVFHSSRTSLYAFKVALAALSHVKFANTYSFNALLLGA